MQPVADPGYRQIEQFLEEHDVVVYFSVVAISYITGFIGIFGLFFFKKFQRLLIIQRRYPKLVIMETVVCVIGLFTSLPLDYNSTMRAVRFSSSDLNQIITYSGIFISSFTAFFMLVIEALRLWLISYDLHYLSCSKNSQWKSQIDTSYADKNWYLRKKSTWGNQLYLGKYVFIYFLVFSTSKAIVHSGIEAMYRGNLWIYHSANIAYATPAVLTVFYVYFTTPKHLQDQFLFQYEFKRTMIIWGIGFTFYSVSFSLDFIGYHRLSLTLTSLVSICSLYSPALLVCLSLDSLPITKQAPFCFVSIVDGMDPV